MLTSHGQQVARDTALQEVEGVLSTFGDEVYRIVDGCTGADVDPKPP